MSQEYTSNRDSEEHAQEPYQLGATMLRRLRKRHSVAGRAAQFSTLNVVPNKSSQETEQGCEDEWLSEDDTTAIHRRSWQAGGRSLRVRRSSSVVRSEGQSSPATKRASRMSSNTNRKSSGKGDQRWISLLERNNEELLSQIETLTSDASGIEQELRLQLQAAQEEVINLKEQLAERDKASKLMVEQYESKFAFLRSLHAEGPSSPDDRHGPTTRIRGQNVSEQDAKRLRHERDYLRVKAKASEAELLKLKRRNAALAEQILHKRGLEMTVEGQNRYLLELSSALEESRRTSMSEPSLSPAVGTFPDTPILSPFLPDAQFSNKRPLSFDGTQWAVLAHARRQSLMDLIDISTRPYTNPSTPPLTDSGESPGHDEVSIDQSEVDSRPSTASENETVLSHPNARRRTRDATARPTLRRNESSLWAELYQNRPVSADGLSVAAITEQDTTELPEPGKDSTGCDVTSPALTAYAVQIRSSALPATLHFVFQGWTWLCFISLLMIAVGRIVRDGPEYMYNATKERQDRLERSRNVT